MVIRSLRSYRRWALAFLSEEANQTRFNLGLVFGGMSVLGGLGMLYSYRLWRAIEVFEDQLDALGEILQRKLQSDINFRGFVLPPAWPRPLNVPIRARSLFTLLYGFFTSLFLALFIASLVG